MYHFFVEKEQVGEQLVTITGPDVNHIKNVLRMKPGEVIGVSERGGRALLCERGNRHLWHVSAPRSHRAGSAGCCR